MAERGNSFGLGADQDLLLGVQDGPAPKKMTIPGDPPFFIGPLSRLVSVEGGSTSSCQVSTAYLSWPRRPAVRRRRKRLVGLSKTR